MRMISQRSLTVVAVIAAAAILVGCPKGGVPGGGDLPGGGKIPGGVGGGLDPDACGGYAASEAGRKLKAFLTATQRLDATMKSTIDVVKTSCVMMGEELRMPAGQLKGDAKVVCNNVMAAIKDNMKVAIKPKAKLDVKYKPAVCTVDVQAAARAAAECEGKAEADIGVKCEGSCTGTCNGTCSGKCAGKAGTGGSGGKCNGQCEGTCQGSCSGGCDGHADVDASAQCKADAEVKASVDVQCTEPELDISLDAGLMVDASKAEMTINALKKGLPKILSIKARMKPLQAAFTTWAKAAAELKGVAGDLADSFKDQALCISAQISAAVGMLASIQVNVEVSVEVSASASGSAGI
jgi:modification target Cys-rich repeat protein